MADTNFSYHNPELLQEFLDIAGRIKPRSKTKLSRKQQKQLATAVKRARHLGLLPERVPVKAEKQPESPD